MYGHQVLDPMLRRAVVNLGNGSELLSQLFPEHQITDELCEVLFGQLRQT